MEQRQPQRGEGRRRLRRWPAPDFSSLTNVELHFSYQQPFARAEALRPPSQSLAVYLHPLRPR